MVLAVEKSGEIAAGGAKAFVGSAVVPPTFEVGDLIAATAGESVGIVYPPDCGLASTDDGFGELTVVPGTAMSLEDGGISRVV